jgi:uncharacterized protein YndB with AHSA1/START domain
MNTLKVAAASDREIVFTRVFEAPRRRVFDALTKPDLLKRWHGPHEWSLAVCEVDLRRAAPSASCGGAAPTQRPIWG